MEHSFIFSPAKPLAIDFDPPVKAGNGVLDRLSLTEPTSDQVWFAEQHLSDRNGNRGPRLYQRALMARVARVPETAIDAIPMRAFQRAADWLQRFVQDGLDTAAGDGEAGPSTFRVEFAPPLQLNGVDYPVLVFAEPTLGQLVKADTALGDMSPQRVRMFQQNLVSMVCGENGAVVAQLPISVLNRAATFCMGFTRSGPVT